MQILIVDDDLVCREQLEVLLSAYGECTAVPDGEEALKQFKRRHEQSHPFDLITMDIDMPEPRGPEVVERIREFEQSRKVYRAGKEAKILMITSMTSSEDFFSSFRAGCEWYLRKPVTPGKVQDALAKLDIHRKPETTP